ncbi:hypothetical protein [Streptosporangium amethystogenes]|uniref:hypothetical protein n=1 Tax=Streptosporangium amethystogenes TaxID=2002 RepID=UPI0004CA3F75|nr:hypothetical protein [Streptosporangium amethystogenes]
MSAIGMVFPSVMSLGQTVGRAAPGAASALMGGLQFLFGAITAPIVGLFGESSSMPMAVIILIALLLAVLSLAGLARPWLRHGEISTSHRPGSPPGVSAWFVLPSGCREDRRVRAASG